MSDEVTDTKFRIVLVPEAGSENAGTMILVQTDKPIKDKADGFRWIERNRENLEYGEYNVIKIHGRMRVGPKEVPACTVLDTPPLA